MKTFALEFWHFHVTMEYTMDHWQSDPKATIRGYRCLLYIHIKPVGAALSFHMFGRDLQTNSLNILRDGGGNYCNTQHVYGLKKMKNASYFQNILLLLKIPAPVRFMNAGMFIRLIAVRSRLWSAEKGGGGFLLQRIRIFHTARLGCICWEVLSTIFVFSID